MSLFIGQFLLLDIASATNGSFTENNGQWPAQVHYRASFSQHAVFVERNAFTVVAWSGAGMEHGHRAGPVHSEVQHHAYRVRFLGADAPRTTGSWPLPGVENYFLGNNPAHWGTNARRFMELGVTDLYPGIDLRLSADGSFKYELLVHPGVSPDIIVIGYEGQDGLRLQNGELHIGTSAGTMIEEAPVVYQEREGVRLPIACAYVLEGAHLRYSFPDGYDVTLPLVIDPSLIFATYSGSTSDNFGFCASYDATGHLYSGSVAFSAGYPTTLGSFQPAFGGGNVDITLSKFGPDGSTLIWSTYFGGSANECPVSLAVNADDELYMLALTGSSDLPTTPGAFDLTFNAGPNVSLMGIGVGFPNGTDLAVVRLSANGDALLGGTFIGGTGTDGVNLFTPLTHNYNDQLRGELILAGDGSVLVASSTTSTDLPTTANAPQPTLAGGQDGFILRLSAALDALEWCTYFGGTGNDGAYALCTNSLGEVIVTGGTESADLPMAAPSFNAIYGGAVDGFVARYSANGDQLLSTTFLGTSAYDQAFFVDVDALDAVMVLGQSHGSYPVTPGKYANAGSANFIQKLSADLGTGLWSTVIGNGSGATDISPVAFATDNSGRLLLSGFGASFGMFGQGTTNGLPTTPDAFQATTNGNDFYIAVLSPEAMALEYATFLGGATSFDHSDGGVCRFDAYGNLYLAACTSCGGINDFPTTPGAWSATNSSINCNLAVVKFNLDGTTAITEPGVPGDIRVWPSPSDAMVHISGCDEPPCTLLIMDATGRIVARMRSNGGTAQLSVDGFAPGAYHVHMDMGAGRKHARFVVR